MEIERSPARAVLELMASYGVRVKGLRVADIGAGMGGMTMEAAVQGAAMAAGVEPDDAWRLLARDRLAAYPERLNAHIVGAVGERVPFANASFDVVVSQQVLEHCDNVGELIREVWRLLQPGGFFCFSTENYLGFWEPHYAVFWLPLLPKPLGAAYLRMRGRSPRFLYTAIGYTTLFSVRREWKRAGFVSVRDERIREAIAGRPRGPATFKKRVLMLLGKVLPHRALGDLAVALSTGRRVFQTELDDVLRKPLSPEIRN